ncbi:ABC transporter ATP-binding protein [Acidiphilium sp. AL]|uniref:ABC transporter ATP-binding protein n=1 Tax=Acidiphilium sp. AL TaxID=2871704 RepID=UPI0021CB8960|nr:ABC transporter ATP-binding protein [Acidiphilium sp. AL]
MTALNPVFSIGTQIAETIRLHEGFDQRSALARTLEMLRAVGIPSPQTRIRNFPHQLSGGMRQRVMIAMALACHPQILIADEPTTALDVTVQAQILDLIRELQGRFGMALVLITHDMGIVAEMADRIAVMYAGRKVEEGAANDVLLRPAHPYTRALLACIPDPMRDDDSDGERQFLKEIPGSVPSLTCLPPGCSFASRCEYAMTRCTTQRPPILPAGDGHTAACWLLADPVLS